MSAALRRIWLTGVWSLQVPMHYYLDGLLVLSWSGCTSTVVSSIYGTWRVGRIFIRGETSLTRPSQVANRHMRRIGPRRQGKMSFNSIHL